MTIVKTVHLLEDFEHFQAYTHHVHNVTISYRTKIGKNDTEQKEKNK